MLLFVVKENLRRNTKKDFCHHFQMNEYIDWIQATSMAHCQCCLALKYLLDGWLIMFVCMYVDCLVVGCNAVFGR